ncbi:YkvA family protein [Chloroflexota bacterium]
MGLFQSIMYQGRLVWRLLNDKRISSWLKLVPLVGLVYLLSPIDLIPDLMLPGLGQLDDLAVILLTLKLFVELCPPGVVRDHLDAVMGSGTGSAVSTEGSSGAYIDVPYQVIDQSEKQEKENPIG